METSDTPGRDDQAPAPPRSRRKQGRMSDLPATEVVERYRRGESTNALADAYNVHAHTIRRLLDKHGVRRRQSWKLDKDHSQGRAEIALEDLPAEEIASAYQNGATTAELARAYRVGLKKIYAVLDAQKVPRRTPSDPRLRVLTSEQEAEVVSRYRQGGTQKGLAREFGVSHPTVRAVLQRHGIDPSARSTKPPVRRALTDEQVAEVRSLYAQGLGSPEIARRFGVSGPTILKVIPQSERRPSRTGRMPVRRIELPDREIIDQYQSGASLAAIAQSHGASVETVRQLLERNGVQRRPRNNALAANRGVRPPALSEEEREQAVAQYQQGMSAAAVAQAMGVSKGTVQRVLTEKGVMRPSNQSRSAAKPLRTEGLDDVMRSIVERRMAGDSVRSLAREYGMSEATLRGRLKALEQ